MLISNVLCAAALHWLGGEEGTHSTATLRHHPPSSSASLVLLEQHFCYSITAASVSFVPTAMGCRCSSCVSMPVSKHYGMAVRRSKSCQAFILLSW